MDALESLTKKVQQAASELIALKKEKVHLLEQVENLRAELQQAQKVVRDGELHRRQQEKIKTRLEKLSRKIEKHLMSDQTMATAVEGGN